MTHIVRKVECALDLPSPFLLYAIIGGGLVQAFCLDVFPALEDSRFAGNLRFLEILP